MCGRDWDGQDTQVEPENAIQLHPMSDWKRETRDGEVSAGAMGGSNLWCNRLL